MIALLPFAYLDPGEADSGLSTIAVVGIVIGGLLLLILVLLAIRFFWRAGR